MGRIAIPIDLKLPSISTNPGAVFWWPEVLVTNNEMAFWKFEDGSTGHLFGTVQMPANVAGIPLPAIRLWYTTIATAGNVRLQVATKAVAVGESVNFASYTVETARDITVPALTYRLAEARFPASGSLSETPASNEIVFVRIERAGGHANDTLAASFDLIEAFYDVDVT